MKYNIIGDNNYLSEDIVLEVLKNRNANEDIFDYSESDLPHYTEFSNMENAIKLILKHGESNSNIAIVYDSDPDGLTSGSIIYNYLMELFPELSIQTIIHEKRVHGIFLDELEEIDIDLLIVPDAGSDNKSEVSELHKRGIDVIIIDHHDISKEDVVDDLKCILVNNAIDNKYTNLSGAGMAFILCKGIDEETWSGYADKYIDLAMLGCVSDMMPISEPYMQYIVQTGMSNLNNMALKAIVEAQNYSIGDVLNPTKISFYITPLLNSVYRLGDIQLKKDLVNAFCYRDNNTYIYKPTRGKNKGEEFEETINEKVSRACQSINEKRKRMGKKAIKEVFIHEGCKINLVRMDSKYGENGIARLVANGMSRNTMKPTIAYYENNKGNLVGSMSSGDLVDNFKDLLNETDIFKYVSGHQGASGFEIKKEKMKSAVNSLNEKFSEYDFEKIIDIDFEIPYNDFNGIGHGMAVEICELDTVYGRGFEIPKIAIVNIEIPISQIELLGSKKNTIKIQLSDDIFAIMFNSNEEFYQEMIDWKETCSMNLIGKFDKNEYGDNISYQLIIQEIEITDNKEKDNELDEEDWSW